MIPAPPHPPSSLGLRFSLVNDSEGWLCIQEVSGEVHTARPLQGARPGDTYTVLVEAQDAGMDRQWWGLWEGYKPQTDRWIGSSELPPWGPCWHILCPTQEGGMRGWVQCPSLRMLGLCPPPIPPSCYPPTLSLIPRGLLRHIGFRHRLGAEGEGLGKWKEDGALLGQACQKISLSGTLRPGVEDSE